MHYNISWSHIFQVLHFQSPRSFAIIHTIFDYSSIINTFIRRDWLHTVYRNESVLLGDILAVTQLRQFRSLSGICLAAVLGLHLQHFQLCHIWLFSLSDNRER